MSYSSVSLQADVAELVDAIDSKSILGNRVQVRFLSSAFLANGSYPDFHRRAHREHREMYERTAFAGLQRNYKHLINNLKNENAD